MVKLTRKDKAEQVKDARKDQAKKIITDHPDAKETAEWAKEMKENPPDLKDAPDVQIKDKPDAQLKDEPTLKPKRK